MTKKDEIDIFGDFVFGNQSTEKSEIIKKRARNHYDYPEMTELAWRYDVPYNPTAGIVNTVLNDVAKIFTNLKEFTYATGEMYLIFKYNFDE